MSDMDAVNSFNAELQSLYDVKPPISKGKMTSITRAALKAVKLYKHVVQSVEKFIQKCKAEYKIPGLYVIDSIIRQSRHQFGSEKDVFAPRFSRNIQTTFVHLYRCPEEDKAKIIRVLNLWQKNSIFTPEVIQPLFDLADPQNPMWDQINNQNLNSEGGMNMNTMKNSSGSMSGSTSNHASGANSSQLGFPSLPPVHFNKKVLDYDYGDGDDDGGPNSSSQGQTKNSDGSGGMNSNTNTQSLDALGSILANPEILRQLQTLQEQMAAAAAAHSSNYASTPEQERQRKLAELSKQEAAFDQRLAETVARLPFAKDCELPLAPEGDSRGESSSGVDQNSNQLSGQSGSNPNVLLPPPFFQQLAEQQKQSQHHHQQSSQHQLFQILRNASNAVGQQNPFSLPMNFPIQGVPPPYPPPQDNSSSGSVPHHGMFGQSDASSAFFNHLNSNNQQPQITISQKIYEEIDLCDDSKDDGGDTHRGRSKRSRSHDRYDSGRRGRRTSRSRSRSRGRSKRSYRSRSRERAREEREKEKERQRKGFPPAKKEHLSICSTTLWVGHLSKLVSQEEISDTFGTYGDIVSIDLISPRGCAFIVMNRRQDAGRALDRLKNTKLQGKTITLAWAPGKGVKGKEWKDYWEVGDGVSYIPWSKLRDDTNLEEFEDGGCLDEDTLPEYFKNRPQPPSDGKNLDQKTHVPPLPPLDNENSQDSNSMIAPPLPPPTAGMPGQPPPPGQGLPSLLDHAALAAAMSKANDSDSRQEPPPMPPFGMGPPGMGMMPMGMNLMVPPPMLAMPGPFQGMASLPGMPAMMGMGMVPAPAMPVPPVTSAPPPGPPGLLGDMPPHPSGMPPQLNDSMISNEESVTSVSDLINNSEEPLGSKRGKKRSRFDDPEEKMSPPGDNSGDTGNFSPSQDPSRLMKDERPVFERLKSLAEGYGFGNQEKQGGVGVSLLGNPPGLGGPRPLMSASFTPPPGLLGTRPVRQPSLFSTAPPRHHSPAGAAVGGWGGFGDNTENPFLNPNPSNPFATASSGGNPFVPGNFSANENPFDIGPGKGGGNPFAHPPGSGDRGGFGGRRGWGRDGGEWGRGRGGRGGRGNWRGRGGGGWGGGNELHQSEEMDNDLESRGGYRGGRGGRGRDLWGGRGGGSDKHGDRRGDRSDRDRPRSREGDRGDRGSSRSRRSRSPSQRREENNDRGSRRRRNSSNERDSGRRRSRHRSGDDNRRPTPPDNRRQSNPFNIQPQEDWELTGDNETSWKNRQANNQDGGHNEENWENNDGNNMNQHQTQPADEQDSRLNEDPSSWSGETQEESEYPPQEEVTGEEEYPSQEQLGGSGHQNYEGEDEENSNSQGYHHHQQEKTEEEGEQDYDMGDNEAAAVEQEEYQDDDGGGCYERNQEFDEEDNEAEARHPQGSYNEEEEQSYNNHGGMEDEEEENSEMYGHRNSDYSSYNNEPEEYEDSRNRNNGDYCADGDYSEQYNNEGDSNSGNHQEEEEEQQEPESTCYDNMDRSPPPQTKCTFNNVNSNSSNNSVAEEVNSISS